MNNAPFSPSYAPPAAAEVSPAGPSRAPEISAAQAARGLGDKLPYSGGAMATHKPMGVPSPAGYTGRSRAPSMKPSQSYPLGGGQMGHIVHDPRFVG